MIEALLAADRSAFLALNSFHLTSLDPIMKILSGQLVWAPIILLFFHRAFRELSRKDFWLFVLFLALVLIASDVTSSYLLKNMFTRMRPCREADLAKLIYQFGQKCGGRFGFVSSHAANSIAGVFFGLRSLRKGRWWHLLWLLPLLVGFSRIYLGVHYPGDILGGFAVGLIWAGFFAWIFRRSKGRA